MLIGNIVVYRNSGRVEIGTISEEKDKNVKIKNIEGKIISLKQSKIEFTISNKAKVKDEKELKLLYNEMIDEATKINLEDVYEVLVDEECEGFKLSEIADLYFVGTYNKQQLFSLFYTLFNNNIYFKFKNDLFLTKKKSEVEERKRLNKTAEEQKFREIQKRKECINWLKKYFYFYYNKNAEKSSETENSQNDDLESSSKVFEDDPEFSSGVPEKVLEFIEAVKNYAIFSERTLSKSKAIELLREIKSKTSFRMVSSQYESAFKLMYELGVFEEDENLSILKYRIPTEFNKEVITITDGIKEFKYDDEKNKNRIDFREHHIFTIDDEDTKDIDDGLSIIETPKGYQIFVHIADVSYYIEKDSILDEEALQRATTVYLPIGKISMFPEKLSENYMSLIENEARPTLTFSREFDKSYNEIKNSDKVYISTIKVKKRLSFLEAEKLIINDVENKETKDTPKYNPEEYAKLHKNLNILFDISENLRKKRIENGAIDFNTPGIKVKVDENKNITIKRLEANMKSQLLVKEMMVLANNISANYCLENDIHCIFITQPGPDVPIEFDMSKKLSRKEIYEILKKLKKSEMGTTPAKHSGLGIEAYTQATSPIRRYNDLLVHRQLKSFINKLSDLTLDSLTYSKEEIQIVAATAEKIARETMSIERESKRYWILKYLSGKIGETTTAMVVRKLNINYKVLLDNTITGAILLTNEKLESGDVINVKIESVRIRQDNITVSLVQ